MDQLSSELTQYLKKNFYGEIEQKYINRIKEGGLTREENSQSHFCVCFLTYDPDKKQVFLGLHKKSGKWLCTGGHIESGYTLHQALAKEIWEELGLKIESLENEAPALLTTTLIENTFRDACRLHFDVWFFMGISKEDFQPNIEALIGEFHETRWFDLQSARELNVSKSMMTALDFIEKTYF